MIKVVQEITLLRSLIKKCTVMVEMKVRLQKKKVK